MYVEGLVHITELGGEYFRFDEARQESEVEHGRQQRQTGNRLFATRRQHGQRGAALLDTRLALHNLDEVCEDQRAALQDWIEALKTWPDEKINSTIR